MTEELKLARKLQRNLRAIGLRSTIEVKHDMTVVSGADRRGEPFAIRIGRPTDIDGVNDFAEKCDKLRMNPRKNGDFILLRPLDA
jgi:hypothetical protein